MVIETDKFIFKNKQRLLYDPITSNYMPYGNGCWRCNNCFECNAGKDCKQGSTTVQYKRERKKALDKFNT